MRKIGRIEAEEKCDCSDNEHPTLIAKRFREYLDTYFELLKSGLKWFYYLNEGQK